MRFGAHIRCLMKEQTISEGLANLQTFIKEKKGTCIKNIHFKNYINKFHTHLKSTVAVQ